MKGIPGHMEIVSLDDISDISNDIEKASEIIDSNFGGELSDCEENLILERQAVREVKEFLMSAVSQLDQILEDA